MNPAIIAQRSHSEYVEGTSLEDMLREDLVAERIAIQRYREMITFFGTEDPTSRRLMEEILAVEEEHADDMADLLFAVEPDNVENVNNLYFADEVPGIRCRSKRKMHRSRQRKSESKSGKGPAGRGLSAAGNKRDRTACPTSVYISGFKRQASISIIVSERCIRRRTSIFSITRVSRPGTGESRSKFLVERIHLFRRSSLFQIADGLSKSYMPFQFLRVAIGTAKYMSAVVLSRRDQLREMPSSSGPSA